MSSSSEKALIQPNSFVKVIDDTLATDGVGEGNFLYVIKLQPFPFDKSDLYNQRLHLLCHKYLGGGRLDLEEVLIVDPAAAEKVAKGKNKSLMRKLELFFANTEGSSAH